MLSTNTNMVQKLQLLAQLYQLGPVNEVTHRTLDKMLSYEATLCEEQLALLEADLKLFETRYKLSSMEFFQRYQSGQIADDMDYVEWASLFQMVERLRQRKSILSQWNR